MQNLNHINQLDLNGVYSYADYLLWSFEERVELIKGRIFKMSPAPNRKHQQTVGNIYFHYRNFFNEKQCGCDLLIAPFDVRLYDSKRKSNNDKDIFTVVQPDLCIVCDKDKLDEQGCIGAPDLIVEILSKGNSRKEMRTKYDLYEENGVKEYWIVFPYEEVLQQFVLNEQNKYVLHRSYVTDESVQSVIFPDMLLPLAKVFEE
jgi:Uma2 family endonuclease